METMLQGLVIIGGLTFSIAASLLIEELIFGRIVRLAFTRHPAKQQPQLNIRASTSRLAFQKLKTV
jgi:hypothetical protein